MQFISMDLIGKFHPPSQQGPIHTPEPAHGTSKEIPWYR